MGIGSILMSFLFVGNFAFFVVYYRWMWGVGMGPSWRTMLFQVTNPRWMAFLTGWIGLAAGLGYGGYRLARSGLGPGRRASLAATAARFSTWGLVGCGLDLALIAGMLAYRWTR